MALRAPQLEASPELASALGHTTKALCGVIAELLRQTSAIEAEGVLFALRGAFHQRP